MQLRPEVRTAQAHDQSGEPILVLRDELTRRSFAMPPEAEEIVSMLSQPVELEHVCSTLAMGFEREEIVAFIEQLERRRLLVDQLDTGALRAQITKDHRLESWAALKNVLRYTFEKIPIYRDRYAAAKVELDAITHPHELHRVPMLTKADIRAHYPDGFVPDGMSLDDLLNTKTIDISRSSGTSAGDRLQMISSRNARSNQMIAGALLNHELHAVIDAQQSVLTSMHCADPNFCVRDEPLMENRVREGIRHLLIPPDDPGAPTRAELQQITDEIRAHKPQWFDCNPSYLATVSYALLDAGIEPPRVPVITTGFEYCSELHRRLFRKVWGASVYNRYTASEVGNFQIIECEHGGMHVNDKYYYAEVVRDGRHARPGEIGRLLQTHLKESIPLVRYDTGDLFVAAGDEACACGGVSARVAAIAGRARDLIAAGDGTPRTTREIDETISAVEGVRFYQLAQTAPKAYAVKVVSDPSADGAAVRERVREVMHAQLGGGVDLRVDAARRVYPEASGKFRLTRSELPDVEKLISAYSIR